MLHSLTKLWHNMRDLLNEKTIKGKYITLNSFCYGCHQRKRFLINIKAKASRGEGTWSGLKRRPRCIRCCIFEFSR